MMRVLLFPAWAIGAGMLFVGGRIFAVADRHDWSTLGAIGFALALAGSAIVFATGGDHDR
jgi:hypothetical protein